MHAVVHVCVMRVQSKACKDYWVVSSKVYGAQQTIELFGEGLRAGRYCCIHVCTAGWSEVTCGCSLVAGSSQRSEEG